MAFEPAACDYLKKFDSNNNCWDIMENDEKDFLCRYNRSANKQQLSPGLVVSDWSIAPPQDDPSTYPNTTTVSSTYNNKIEDPSGRSALLPVRSLFHSSLYEGINKEHFAAPDDHQTDKLTTYDPKSSSSLVGDPWTCRISPRNNNNVADVMTFGSRFSKPLHGVGVASKPPLESTNNSGKESSQGVRNSSPVSSMHLSDYFFSFNSIIL